MGAGHVPTVEPRRPRRSSRDVAIAGAATGATGRRHDLHEPVLVVNQKAKLIEVNNEYAIYDQHGTQIGAVRQVGQSAAKKALRVLSSVDQFLTHKLQVVDMQGNVLLALTRPAKVMKSKVIVQDASGAEVGQIVQQNMIGKIRFGLEAGGHTYGSINAENWRAWNFRVEDHAGDEVARITKTWEGLAKTMFTTADNFVVQIHRPLEEPLRTLVVASSPRRRHRPQAGQPRLRLTVRAGRGGGWQATGDGCARSVPSRGARRGRAGAGGGPDAAGRPHVGAAARRAPRCVADFVPRARRVLAGTACATEAFAQLDAAVEVAWAAGDGDAVTAGPTIGTVSRADGVGAHRRADGAELPVPPVRRRHDHPALRRGGGRRAGRPGSGTPARPRRGCGR